MLAPDVLVERMSVSLDCETELLNITVKSGYTITQRDMSQLRYELLPVLLKEEFALGIIICAGEAYLDKYVRTDNAVNLFRQRYEFTSTNLC